MDILNYRFRLYPTKEQELTLEQTLDGSRWVYNYFLSMPVMSEYDMNYALTELKEKYPWLRNYHSKMLQMVCKQIASARKTARHEKLSYKYKFTAFTYNQSGFRIGSNKLLLSKIGTIKMLLHRQPVNVKQVTICKKKDGSWYAVVSCELLRRHYSTIVYNRPVGIDIGITNYAYDSHGNHADNPLFLAKALKPLRRIHRKVSRRKYDSQNYKKAVSWLQRLNARIANKRRNFLHNLSAYYSRRYDLIFLERLSTQNMIRNHLLARHIADSSWGTFKQMLKYKSNRVVEVDPYNTSAKCSKCDNLVPKILAARLHECDKCGAVLDRDHNAAFNILQKGLELLRLPMQHGEVTPVEIQRRVVEAGTNPLNVGVVVDSLKTTWISRRDRRARARSCASR